MSTSNGRQFDPVASAATAALDTTQRGLRNFQSQMGAPKIPVQSQSFSGLRSVVTSVAQFSPANVLAKGNLPIPGQSGQALGGLPQPNQLLPGMQGQGALPTPDQLVPTQMQQQMPSPPTPQTSSGGKTGKKTRDQTGSGPTAQKRR